MEKVGRAMVQRCGGLPLAIVVLGGILKPKYTLKHWKGIDRDIVSYLSKGEGIGKNICAVEQVLLLSYNNLPGHLKTCFLYLGEYPEDEVISAYELYVKWIIGGVVSKDDQREGETMLELAERYLADLAQRSMVQVELDDGVTWLGNSKFKSCGLHDLMRDLCMGKAKEEEFSSVITIKRTVENPVSSTGVPGRLAIYCYNGNYDKLDKKGVALYLESVLGSIDGQRIRSLVLSSAFYNIQYPSCIGNCDALRYLELKNIRFPRNKLPKQITRLVHLRYLKVEHCLMRKLPTSIGNMRFLQVLHIHSISRLLVPNVFWKLRQLMSLNLTHSLVVKKDQKLQLDGLGNLEVLQGIKICQFNVQEVAKLANLQFIELSIRENSTFEDAAWFLNYVNTNTSHHINGARLSFNSCDFRPKDGRSILHSLFECSVSLTWWVYNSKLPKLNFDETDCSYQLNNITQIVIEASEFEEDPFQILEKLPNLQVLALRNIQVPWKLEMVCSVTGFSQLRKLQLECLEYLKVWTMDKGAMLNLTNLKIRNCINLKMLPDQLRYLRALKTLEILQMPKMFRKRVGVVNGIQGEDYEKIQHVHTLIIQ